MRKVRPVASERLALGCMAELGSLRFAQSETNSEATHKEKLSSEKIVHKWPRHIEVQLPQGWQITPRGVWSKKRPQG